MHTQLKLNDWFAPSGAPIGHKELRLARSRRRRRPGRRGRRRRRYPNQGTAESKRVALGASGATQPNVPLLPISPPPPSMLPRLPCGCVLTSIASLGGGGAGGDFSGEYTISRIQKGNPEGMVQGNARRCDRAGSRQPRPDEAAALHGGECRRAGLWTPGSTPTGSSAGDVYPGYTRGTDPNNNDQPLVVICAPNPQALFPVTLVKDGGANGSQTSAATWSYTVKDSNGTQLATLQQPQWPRQFGTFNAATSGLAYFGTGGGLCWLWRLR